MNNIEEICKIASSWWTNVIKNPKMDNGDESQAGMLINILATLNTSKITPEQQKQFNYELYEEIKNTIKDYDDTQIMWLDVDYEPNKNIKETIDKLRQNNYEVVIVSTRCATEEGRDAIMNYLFDYGIVVDKVCKEKPPAICYIDDRAICYDPKMNNLYEIITSFKPNQQIEQDFDNMDEFNLKLNQAAIQTKFEEVNKQIEEKYPVKENPTIYLKILQEWIDTVEKYL